MKIYYTLPLVLFLLAVTSSFGSIQKLNVQRNSRSSLHTFTISLGSRMIPEKNRVRQDFGTKSAFTISLGSKMVPEKSRGRQDYGTKSVVKKAVVNKSVVKKAVAHKKWGVDATHEAEYWFDTRIHTLGNVGFMGALHAASAALATKVIDVNAYNGVDVRQQVANELFKSVRKGKARVVDLCCGVGTSTRALCEAFPEAEAVVGVDTSAEMLAMARFLTNHLSFFKPVIAKCYAAVSAGYPSPKGIGATINQATRSAVEYARVNAEDTKLPCKSFDLVTIMYAFHEAPMEGREKMLREARRLLNAGGTLAVIDISTDYKPSPSMLLGEPYVLEYQSNIQSQLTNLKGFFRPECKILVPGHVNMWLLKRGPTTAVI